MTEWSGVRQVPTIDLGVDMRSSGGGSDVTTKDNLINTHQHLVAGREIGGTEYVVVTDVSAITGSDPGYHIECSVYNRSQYRTRVSSADPELKDIEIERYETLKGMDIDPSPSED